MIRKKWTGGGPMLLVETKDEFHKVLPLGLPVLLGGWPHGKSLTNSSALLCDRPKFSRQRLQQFLWHFSAIIQRLHNCLGPRGGSGS